MYVEGDKLPGWRRAVTISLAFHVLYSSGNPVQSASMWFTTYGSAIPQSPFTKAHTSTASFADDQLRTQQLHRFRSCLKDLLLD